MQCSQDALHGGPPFLRRDDHCQEREGPKPTQSNQIGAMTFDDSSMLSLPPNGDASTGIIKNERVSSWKPYGRAQLLMFGR